MYDLNDGEILHKVTQYFLHRRNDSSVVTIEIFHPVAPFTGKFLAAPEPRTMSEKSKYTGTGDTEEEALAELISLIKDVPSSELV